MSVVGDTCLRTAARLVTAWSGDRERLAQAAELCWQAGFWFLVDWPRANPRAVTVLSSLF